MIDDGFWGVGGRRRCHLASSSANDEEEGALFAVALPHTRNERTLLETFDTPIVT